MLYFAYGSNLYWNQMLARCPSATFVCVARLDDYQLAFTRRSVTRGCGVADVIPQPGSHVWGVVYEIAEDDVPRLDASEGYRQGRPRKENSYIREERKVHKNGDTTEPRMVSVYLANQEKNPPRPNAEYKRLLVEGAKYWKLPQDYISALESIQIRID